MALQAQPGYNAHLPKALGFKYGLLCCTVPVPLYVQYYSSLACRHPPHRTDSPALGCPCCPPAGSARCPQGRSQQRRQCLQERAEISCKRWTPGRCMQHNTRRWSGGCKPAAAAHEQALSRRPRPHCCVRAAAVPEHKRSDRAAAFFLLHPPRPCATANAGLLLSCTRPGLAPQQKTPPRLP